MIPHPAALDTAIGSTAYRPFTRVTFLNPDDTGTKFSFVVADSVDGYVTSDADQWPRTTLDMVVPTAVIPSLTTLPANAWGGLVRLEVGAVVGSTTHVFQAHELDVYEVTVQRPAGTINIRAVSREARVNEARQPYSSDMPAVPASSIVNFTVTEAIYGDAFTGLYPVLWQATNDDQVEYNRQGDQWPVILDALDQCGAEAYFRWDNVLVVRDVPVKGSPVATIKSGTGGTLLDYRSIRRWAASVVNITYTRTDGTEQVGVWEQTTGPTKATGPYGRHVRLDVRNIGTRTLPTTTRANRAAATLAKRAAAPLRRVELECIPMPWLEPGDTVQVQLLGETTENHLVTGVRWPLSQLEPMTLITQDVDYT